MGGQDENGIYNMEKRRMEGGRAKHIRETGEEEITWMKESMKEGRCESGGR